MSSTTVRFVDTNILLYTISTEPSEHGKAVRAKEIRFAPDLAFSAQVLQEFFVQATRPTRAGALTREQASEFIESLLRFPVAPITTATVLAAIATSDRFQISYWDAAILEAARALGCGVVLSEDLSDGMDYAGVRVENPFRDC
jgi:predicted nucleic acid-binding protein